MSKTLICFILDHSGSMYKNRSNVVTGVNKFIENQKKIKNDKARMIMFKFDSKICQINELSELENVKLMQLSDYEPVGNTALYDAISFGIHSASVNKGSDENVIFVIMTDGEDNASMELSLKDISDIISNHEATGEWTFLYIGPNSKKWSEDTEMCINNCKEFDEENTQNSMDVVDSAVSSIRISQNK